ncbi:MAG: biotin/lipoyl-binding protein, partial [Bacteroidales bacterium]
MKKIVRIITVGAVVSVILLAWLGGKRDRRAIVATVQEVQLRTIVESIPAGGKIKPVTEVKISPDVSGEIVELRCREGDGVKKGDLLIKIKEDIFISLCERAEASLNAVKAQLLQQEANRAQSELNWKRNRTLFDDGAISKSEFESFTTEYEIAKAQVEAAKYNVKSAEAALKEAEENLSKSTIYAP